MTNFGFTISIGFCFLLSGSKENIIWVFQFFKELEIKPSLVITDDDQAQKKTVEEVSSYVTILLCSWHSKNPIGNEDFPAFEASWRMITQAFITDLFNHTWLDFQNKYSTLKSQP
ncbi:hypothetical protein GcC1_015035 [Golovinomyces cichoracearum]|uniref:Uncharacterized protein n=1 Tax=Golovinomyces cichoracearum TaxID=62708 RepID=A0A420J6J0_9PEZI|nr:hypothetical protein GcC1_015035 [Golovinomyces cichoracearum]